MLVDDDDSVREVLTEMLGLKGWVVGAFSDAESAMEELRLCADRYDVLVSDINMPGSSGIELLTKAKAAAPSIPIVMITGYPSIDIAVEAMKSGATDFLTKPFKGEELERVIRKVTDDATEAYNRAVDTRIVAKMPDAARRRLEEKIKELSILHTIGETLDEANEKEDVFRKTMDLGSIIADAERAFILVVEKDSNELVVRASLGYDESMVIGKRFHLKNGPFKSVIEKRCYSNVLLPNDELGPLAWGIVGVGKKRALTLVPILINQQVVVIMGLTGEEGPKDTSTDTLTLLLNLAAKASLKLENIALTENIFSSVIGAINSLINALDARDTYTKDHSSRVTEYALQIAKALQCAQEVADSIRFAGPLHDIGKIGVRDDVLLKKGNFTQEERDLMKAHVVTGEEILRPLHLLDAERAVVLYHHERWDGGGYPHGLTNKGIPLSARVFSVADTFDAMTSSRPYRNALTPDVAREEIIRCSGTQFDPEVVSAFLNSTILKG
jgi:response regulator RpfG family c-di-GMP phosphodiesterase